MMREELNNPLAVVVAQEFLAAMPRAFQDDEIGGHIYLL
jgi:hypothetical protein